MICNEVAKWNAIIKSTNSNPHIIEAAFLNIAVSVEKFLSQIFFNFCTGNEPQINPFRKIIINDKDEFTQLIKGDAQFIDFWKSIPRCSNIIFNKNPFDLIFNDSDIKPCIEEMRTIRNYLAHRSDESKEKYIKVSLNGQPTKYIEVGSYLLSKTKKSITNYARIIENLEKIEKILSDKNIGILVSGI